MVWNSGFLKEIVYYLFLFEEGRTGDRRNLLCYQQLLCSRYLLVARYVTTII